jgi:nucleoside-diphosphate-sugar epimerase
LSGQGFEVHVFTRRYDERLPAHIHQHVFDLFDHAARQRYISEIQATHLLHAAWITSHGAYWDAPENESWKAMSLELVTEFAEHGGMRMVGIGTCAEYDWSCGVCSEHDAGNRPASLYGRQKRETCSRLLDLFEEGKGLTGGWARMFHLYGPHENPRRLVPHVVQSCLQGKEILCSDGKQVRDYMYIEDAAAAVVSVLVSSCHGAINIGSGNRVELKSLIQLIADKLHVGHLVKLGALPRPPGDPDLLVPDLSRFNAEISFVPQYSLGQGLDKTISFIKGEHASH